MAGQLLSFPASPQDNQNTTAFNSLPDPFQDRLEQIVKTTPDVVSHPEILYGLAQQNGINGYTLGMALNHLATTGTNSVALSDYAASQRQTHGPGILGDIGSFVSGIPNDVSQVAQGAYHSGAGMVEGLYRSQISPLLQSSYWTPQNLKYQFSDQALEHETLAAGKSVAQSFFRIAHMQAFLTSMAHRHGWAYTIGTFLPSIALGAATGGAFAPAGVEAGLAAGTEGVGIGAEAAATAADTAGAEAAASAGTEAATTEASDVLSLVKSMAKKIPKGQDLTPEEQQLWDSGEFTRLVSTGAARGVLHNISERTLEILGAPVGLAMRGIGAARGYLGGPIGAQVRYFSMQAAAQNDPQTAALWDATANGSVYDANGNRVGSAGEAFATYLGLTPNDMLFAPVAGLDDFYGHWLGVDPLGAVGHTLAISRSAGGFAANTIMGRWFNGIGLHAPEDVWNVYQRQSQMRRAVQYMATHNAADINRTFKGFFTGSEAAKVMLRDIGKATTHQQVLDILAAKVGTDAMTRRIAPMLSFKSRLWATMAIGHGVQVAAENFLSDTYEQIEAHRAEFFAKTGMNPIAHTATEVATRDGGLRARAALGRFLSRRIADLSPRPMALDTEVLDYNNRRFRFGDLNAIPAIGNNARAMGLFSHLDISLFEDALTHASPEEWNNLIESHYATMAEGALRAAGNANSDGAISLALAEFKAQLRFYQGPDGGGREATAYTAGEAGGRYDLVASADRPDDPRRAGFALNHLGQGQYFDPRQIRQLVKRLQIGLVDGTTNFDLRGMQYLEGDSVEQLAKARNATLDSVSGEVRAKTSRWESRGKVGTDVSRQSYDTTREGIDNVLKAYRETAELKASQQFAGFHDFISTSLHASEMQLQQAREELVRNAVEDSLSAQIAANETVERLQGQVTALTHYADEINQRIASPTMSSADIKRLADQHAADIAAGGGLDKVAEKRIADALHNRLIDVRDKKLRVWDPGSWNAGFYNWHQHMVNFLNKTLSETFVPMALFSGGWAIRVASSELLLNAMRIGGWNAFNSQMVYYIAKHEVRGTALSDLEKQWVHKDVSQIFIGMRYYAHALKKGVRDILGGALEGIERNLFKNMSKAERDRFLEDAVALRIRHGRELPGGIHGAKDIAQMDRFGTAKWTRDSTVEAFTHHMGLHANDQLSNPVFKDIQQWIRDNPTRSYEAEGSNSLLSEAEQSQLFDHLSNKAYDRLLTTSPEELSRFGRDDMRLWDETLRAPKGSRLDNAKGDHARTLAYNAMHSVMGHGNEGGVIWHSLVDQVADNNIEPTIQLAAQLDAMGEAIPKHVPVADALKIDGIKSLLSPHLIQMASDYGHEKVLGPIVNQLVRGPLFTYEYHVAMEAEREFVDKGLLTLDQAEVRAEVAAIINLKKYVHNPMERTNLENNMRVLAPFYFAQNQAWRRALRVLESDPGAFERYLKLCLAATNWIGAHKVQGKDSFSIPGTNWLGARAGSLFGQGPVPFDFSGSIGSVQSVVPTGAEAGTGILSDIARPSWDPLVTWPVQQVDRYFGTPEADKLAEGFLGPIAFRSGAFGEALPSTSLRGVLGAIWYQEGWGNGPTQTVMLQAQAATMEQKYTQWQQEATAEYEKIVKGGTAPLSVDARAAWIQGETLSIGSQWMSDPANKHEFLHDMKEVAVAMMLTRSVLSFGSPVSLQIQEKFTKNVEFQKILNGLPKGEQNFITAADIFNAKFPNHLFDLVSHSKTLYSPYPETTAFTNIYDKWRTGLTKYPFATAYLIPQGGTYDPTANGRQLAMNLRAVDTPSEFYDAMQKALGNQWFYSYLTPIMAKQYPDGHGGVNSTGYGLMTTYAKQYGNNENPLWYQSFASGGAKADKIAALKQMNELLGDKSVPASVLSNKDRQTFVMLMHQYGNAVYEYDQLKAAGDSSTASLIYEQWYQQCQEAATLPQYARQSFFLTSVLATLPTRQ